jgi:hypothetical protein
MYTASGYLGLDVLDGLPANEGAVQDGYVRRLEVLDPGPGLMTVDARDVAPDWVRPVLWRCTSRAGATELREFLARRRGRAVPFWLPTFDEDLTLAADALTSVSTLSIVSCGYSNLLFPLGPARRHLALQASPGTPIYRKVTAAVDNQDGTETLTLDTAIDRDLLAGRAMISFLRYCRLDDDGPVIDWTGPAYCECALPVRELAAECPS